MRRVALILSLLIAGIAAGQGSFGGGLQQGRQGPLGGEGARERTEYQNGGLWTAREAILTPGDRVEFKVTAKRGQALFAAATSQAFDPALEVDDAKGHPLAKNDDRAEGDQAPFLILRFPEDGDYTLKVLSFRSAAGGQFNLRTRLLSTFDATLKPSIVERKADDPREPTRITFRLTLKAGQTVDLQNVQSLRQGFGSLDFEGIVGPTGVAENDLERVPTDGGPTVFTAKKDGDYYVDYGLDGPAKLSTDFREVATVNVPSSGETALDFAAGELKLVEFPVKPDLIVWTKIEGRDLSALTSAPVGVGERVQDDPTHGGDGHWSWFLPNVEHGDPDLDQIHVFHGTGKARFAIRSPGNAQRVTIRNSEGLPAWPEGQTLRQTLAIGEAKYFLLPAKRSEIMHVAAKAGAFVLHLDLFRLDGGVEQSLGDRRTRSAENDLYFEEPKLLIARVTCEGYGGSGEFTLRRDTAVPTAYAVGTVQTATPGDATFLLYGVDLTAKTRYQMTIEGGAPGLTILDEDGTALPIQSLSFGGVTAIYFEPPRTGRYRLWWRGSGGSWRFRVAPFTPPTVGGG